jgi:hypothetical protein
MSVIIISPDDDETVRPLLRCLHAQTIHHESVALRFHAGHLFAGIRRANWAAARHTLYAALFFLIPAVRLYRILRELRRPGRPLRLAFAVLPWMLPLLAVDALGEMTGYIFGPGDSSKRIARMDFHRKLFMNRKDREQLVEC